MLALVEETYPSKDSIKETYNKYLDNVSPELSATDLMKKIRLNPYDALELADGEYESVEKVMARKADEADTSGLTKSLEENGILEPIVLQKKGSYLNLVDGHHRLAVYLRDCPSKPIPVKYVD